MEKVYREVVDWLSGLKGWQAEMGYRLLSNGNLSSKDFDELVDMLKEGKRFDGKEFPNLAGQQDSGKISLLSISDIINIEGLAPRNPLHLQDDNSNMYVIYGDNGSGKSGYTRIIKAVCGKFGNRKLLPNVYGDDPSAGSCKINYKIDDAEKEVIWQVDDEPIDDLRQVDIFDTDTARNYIQTSQKTTYTPYIVSFFESMTSGYAEITKRLNGEKNSLVSQLPSLPLSYFSTSYGRVYRYLKNDHKEEDIRKYFSVTKDDESALQSLNVRLLSEDPSKNSINRRKCKKELDEIIKSVKTAAELVTVNSNEELKTLRKASVEKRKIAAEGVKVLTANSAIQGVGSETWKHLWYAAHDFSIEEAYPNKHFPNTEEGSLCLLCNQPLGADAVKRLTSFQEYIEGKLEGEAKIAELKYKSRIDALPKEINIDELSTQCLAAGIDDWLSQIKDVRDMIVMNAELMREGADVIPDISEYTALQVSALQAKSDQYEKEASDFDRDAVKFDRDKAIKDKLELEAKKWCSEQIDLIVQEIERLKKVKSYDAWIGETNTYSVTRMANTTSEKTITEEYAKRFNQELDKLGANGLKVELVKEAGKGTIRHSLNITNVSGVRPHDILSEGENRIVALAAFLADVTNGNNFNPFVFDDPISSLDQLFEERTIERLIELSNDRQVLVFTHRLSLLGLISEKCDNRVLLGVKKEYWGAGEIGETPFFHKKPISVLKVLRDERVPKARKILESEGSERYEIDAEDICKKIRIQVERIVELTLLSDVVQRYRRSVQTYNKIHKLSVITREDCELLESYMTKYSIYEHSQPPELAVHPPRPEELVSDLTALIGWHDEFDKRVKAL